MKLNVNDKCSVVLTADGVGVLAEYHREHGTRLEGPAVAEWSGQLWQLMHIWGGEMHMGARQVFVENTIEIVETP